MSDKEETARIARVAAMVQFILGYLNHQEASDAEHIAIGLALCHMTYDRRSVSTDIAVRDFRDGLETIRAINAKQLN